MPLRLAEGNPPLNKEKGIEGWTGPLEGVY
jgi:hypothetical protein